MLENFEASFQKLLTSLLSNYTVSDDTLLEKLLTALHSFFAASGSFYLEESLKIFGSHDFLELEQKSSSFLLELLGLLGKDPKATEKVIGIYLQVIKNEELLESSSAVCGWLNGLKHISENNYSAVLHPSFIKTIISCLQDKRYFVQRQSTTLLLFLICKLESTEEHTSLIEHLQNVINFLITTPSLTPFQRLIPHQLIHQLYSNNYKLLAEAQLIELITAHTLKSGSFNATLMNKALDSMRALLTQQQLQQHLLSLAEHFLTTNHLQQAILLASWLLQNRLEGSNGDFYTHIFLQPLKQACSSVQPSDADGNIKDNALTRGPASSAALRLSLTLLSNFLEVRATDGEVVCRLVLQHMKALPAHVSVCLHVMKQHHRLFPPKESQESLLQLITSRQDNQLLLNEALDTLAIIIINTDPPSISDPAKLKECLWHLGTSTTWETRDAALDFLKDLHHASQRCYCEMMQETGLNTILLNGLHDCHLTPLCTALRALTDTLHCGCFNAIFPKHPASASKEQTVLTQVLQVLVEHDEALARRAALVFTTSYIALQLPPPLPLPTSPLQSSSFFFHPPSHHTRQHLTALETVLADPDKRVLACLQRVCTCVDEDIDWEVKLKGVQFIAQQMAPFMNLWLGLHPPPKDSSDFDGGAGVGVEGKDVSAVVEEATNGLKLTGESMASLIKSLFVALEDYEGCVRECSAELVSQLQSSCTFLQQKPSTVESFQESTATQCAATAHASAATSVQSDSTLTFLRWLLPLQKEASFNLEAIHQALFHHHATRPVTHQPLSSARKQLHQALEDALTCLQPPVPQVAWTSDEEEYMDYTLVDCY